MPITRDVVVEKRILAACQRAVASALRRYPTLGSAAEAELLSDVLLVVVRRWSEVFAAFEGDETAVRRKTAFLHVTARSKAAGLTSSLGSARDRTFSYDEETVESGAAAIPVDFQSARAERFALVVGWLAWDFLALLGWRSDVLAPDPADDRDGWLAAWSTDRAHLLDLAFECNRQFGPTTEELTRTDAQWTEVLIVAFLLDLAQCAGAALDSYENRALHTGRQHAVEALATASLPPELLGAAAVSQARKRCRSLLGAAWADRYRGRGAP